MAIIFREVQLSFKEYVSVNLQYSLRQQKGRLLRLLLLIGVVIGVQVYFSRTSPAQTSELQAPTEYDGWLIAAVTLLAAGAFCFAIWRGLRRRYNRTQFLQKPATYRFTDAGITIDSPTTQGTNSWETIDRLLLMKHLALLTTRNFTVYFLDFRCLEAPATETDFLALLRQHDIPVK